MRAPAPCLPHALLAALIAYSLAGRAQQVQADLAALPAGRVVAIRHWTLEQWAAAAVLARLTALTQLQLSHQAQLSRGSQLEHILQPLVQLRELCITDCRLPAVPAALSCCTQLVHLDLSSNLLAGGWQHLQPLAQLQRLDVCDTAHLPASLQQLTQLTRLDLARCGNVPAVSPHLAALRLLQALNLTQCGLTAVPAAVSALTALTSLYLGHNRLAGGFDHLRPLTRLQLLCMHANGLEEVPAAVAALTALTALTLGHPPGGWQHLRPLAQLSSLDAFCFLDRAPDAHFPLASEAAANLHPAAVERMLAQPRGELPVLLNLLEQRGLPRPL